MYQWLIHVDIWQKPTCYCKAIILQLKINKFNYIYIRRSSLAGGVWLPGRFPKRDQTHFKCPNIPLSLWDKEILVYF